MNLVAKPAPLYKRIRELEKELSKVDGSIRNLSRVVEQSRVPGGAAKLPPLVDPLVADADPVEHEPEDVAKEKDAVRPPRDERFLDYLSTSFERPVVPLRHERNAQRKKAIVTIGMVAILIFWLLHRILL